MRKLPSLNALRAFEAAARHVSFQSAAEELHVTSTAVSHQIRELEEVLGVMLFRRRPRPVQLTAAGRQLFPVLRDALDRIALAVAAIQAPEAAGPLVVTTTPAFASRWLIPRLAELREACGGCQLAVEASEAVADLRSGVADFAIRYARSPDPRLECHELFTDAYFPVCSPALLNGTASVKGFEVLLRHPLIHFEWKRDDPHAPTWPRWVDRARRQFPGKPLPDPASGIRFSEEAHAIEAATLGQGIALVSDVLVERELVNGLLVQASDLSIEGLTFYAMYHPESPREKIILQILHAMRETGPSMS